MKRRPSTGDRTAVRAVGKAYADAVRERRQAEQRAREQQAEANIGTAQRARGAK